MNGLDGAKTVTEMQPAIGAHILAAFESLAFACRITDVKSSYGRTRFQIIPVNGDTTRSQWIEASRIIAVIPQSHANALETR